MTKDSSTPKRSESQAPPVANTDQRRATAFHEAGHAVMAVMLGRPIEKVTICPKKINTGGGRLGACKIQKGRSKPSQDALEDEVLVLLSGMVAESHFTGRYCASGASLDLNMAQRLLSNRAGNERQLERLLKRLLDKTEHLLAEDANAKAIEMIAEEVLQRETISGRSVRHLFEQASSKK